ncbi:hypothetical protein V6N11_039797 [Hibiscus sabdariffa]|uniref:MADS-box domain-containing protein n=1 Tax=Hibiscus sabdariffa TaxID=183260 RepID=A0ABR2RFK9_9ROSI
MASSRKRNMDDETRIQGALSKRRACLMRKASEISVNCNADIALAAFSPCDRFCKFYSREKMRHVLERYIMLPSEKRYQKYEMDNEESASLSQVLCCEKNLQHSLQEIRERKERSRKEMSPPMRKTRNQRRSQGRQTSLVYNFSPGKQVWNREKLNPKTNLHRHLDLRTYHYRASNGLRDRLYQLGGISPGSPGASGSFFGYPRIYRLGSSCLTQQNASTHVYPPIQTHSFIQNLQNRVHRNSSMQQLIMGNPDMSYLPYQQPLRALRASNLYQLRMPGLLNQQMGLGGLGSSSMNQSSMGNDSMTSNVHFQHQQQGDLGITSLGQHANNEFSEGQSNMTSNVQFQPQLQGHLGGTSVGQKVNNVPFEGQQNQMPPSYDNHVIFRKQNPQNGAARMPQTSQLQVNPNLMNLLCSPNYNTIQNFNVTPLLDFESPTYNTVQSLDPTPHMNSESPNCNTLQDLDVTYFFNSESPDYNALQNLDVTPPLDPESPNCNTLDDFDVTSFFNFESPDYSTLQNLDVTPILNSESPDYSTLQNLDVTSIFNVESPNCNTLQDLDVTPTSNSESPNYNIVHNLDATPPLTSESTLQNLDVTPTSNSESISSESFFNLPIHGDDNNVDNGNNNTSINNTIGNNEEENPQPESPCSMFINNILSISSEDFFNILIHEDDNNVNNGNIENNNTNNNNTMGNNDPNGLSISSEAFFSIDEDDNNVNNDNTENSTTNNNKAIGNNDTNGEDNLPPESPCSMFLNNILGISSESFFNTPIHGDDNNVNNGNTSNSSTNINNNTIGNNDTNQEENPRPESPCSIFINSLLNEPTMEEGTSESAANTEGINSMEWDDFALPGNITLEDFGLSNNMTLEDFEKLF